MALKIAVIGAGLSGLTIATKLKKVGHSVTVYEKARGPGGRSSTRRTDFGRLDHGAQYFTIRDDGFREFLNQDFLKDTYQEWCADFAIWAQGFHDDPKAQETRYVGVDGMNAICKALAQGLDVKAGVRVEKLSKNNGLWTLLDSNSEVLGGNYDFVISSAPPLQTHDLYLGHSDMATDIAKVQMQPCFTYMAMYDRELNLPHDGVRFEQHPVLGWAANNHSKPQRANTCGIVIQTNFEWSQKHVDDDQGILTQNIVESAEALFDLDISNPSYSTLHRWLYSSPASSSETEYYIDPAAELAACGDWCLGPRFECAYLSGNALAEHIISEYA